MDQLLLLWPMTYKINQSLSFSGSRCPLSLLVLLSKVISGYDSTAIVIIHVPSYHDYAMWLWKDMLKLVSNKCWQAPDFKISGEIACALLASLISWDFWDVLRRIFLFFTSSPFESIKCASFPQEHPTMFFLGNRTKTSRNRPSQGLTYS